MQQKVQFIASVIHEPPLLILDEPFSGLDPVNSATIEEMMMEMRQKGSTIVLSSHRMDQIERMCDSICLINKGQNVLDGDIRAIKKSYGMNTLNVEFTGPDDFLKSPAIEKVTRRQNGAEAKLRERRRSARDFAGGGGGARGDYEVRADGAFAERNLYRKDDHTCVSSA